ncbi:hypothetical protein [Nonomuraea jiangxiensis]|uniref:Integral membrane protein n=1 Tax=Nonomuraea jiangxiensis TaxID=633440 RepID=A0A1G9M6B6_9ACTN|nr:hypothetical protein [Nonomuraea jiangxiensis]SDL69507.1 hypothetical protein SAMN05421869_12970 [Nonomuraea jiangxiensis]
MTALPVTPGRTKLLRLTLATDAVVTAANGLAYLALAPAVSELLGPGPALLRAIGAGLLVYGVAVGLLSTRHPIPPSLTWAVIALNAAWPLASLLTLVTGALDLTTAGTFWTIAQALVVAVFGELQFLALRKTR